MKKLFLACFVFALAVCLLPAEVSAAAEDGFEYEITNGEATITDYYGDATDLTIPDTLGGCPATAIGKNAFEFHDSLISVTFPDNLTTIGEYAFYGCNSLASVTFGKGVTTIDAGAFLDCTGLTDLIIPDSVQSIGALAFCGCTGLASVTIGKGVTTIGGYAFMACPGLTGFHITDLAAWCSVNASGNPLSGARELYLNGTPITELVIPEGVTTIGSSAFQGCTGLTSVTFPDSVTAIGDSAFGGCTGLTSVTIGKGVTTIGNNGFSRCTALKEITVPTSLFSFNDDIFLDTPLETVRYDGTKAQWEKIDLNNNTIFANATVIFNEETVAEKSSNTGFWVAIVALSLAVAASAIGNIIQFKKRKA